MAALPSHGGGRMARMSRPATVALIAAALAGCLGPLEPDVGPPIHEICSDDDGDPTTKVSYTDDVLPLFKRMAEDKKAGGATARAFLAAPSATSASSATGPTAYDDGGFDSEEEQ